MQIMHLLFLSLLILVFVPPGRGDNLRRQSRRHLTENDHIYITAACDKKTRRCRECEGDCDDDDDCEHGLKCFHRSEDEYAYVPGCTGGASDGSRTDYCYDPGNSKPVSKPTYKPVAQPTPKPVAPPTYKPVAQPTPKPVSQPTYKPVAQPTPKPVSQPTYKPVAQPTYKPVAQPTHKPASTPGDTLVAQLGRYPGYTGPLDVGGTITTRHNADDDFMLFKLDVDGVESDCVNCGVHIHTGFTCDDASEVGPHFWLPLSDPDPWDISPDHTYNSTDNGISITGFSIDAGTSYDENVGRAAVVHAQDGTRVGCGLLEPASRGSVQTLYSTIGIYPDYSGSLSVSGLIKVDFFEDGTMDFHVGSVEGLEDNCDLCGVHIHAGTTCADASLVGPHYWNPDVVPFDPWFASEGAYYNSDGNGDSVERSFYLDSGYDFGDNLGHAVVFHAQDGTRIGCGLLRNSESPEPSPTKPTLKPTQRPASKPTAKPIFKPTFKPQQVFLTDHCSDKKRKCGRCEGDCDKDSDCESGLKCFQRDENEYASVPGCSGGGGSRTDYCYQP